MQSTVCSYGAFRGNNDNDHRVSLRTLGRKVTQLAYLQHFKYLPFLQGVMLAGSRVWREMLALAHAHAVQTLYMRATF